jgi:lipoprotein-releasing system ATP-binding protein
MSNIILEVRSISKSFDIADEQPIQILNNISFEVNKGEVFGIMGESGAGKSTLLNVISTIDTPDSGEILYEGKDICRFSPAEIDRFRNISIGFVFQAHHLLAEFDVLTNVMMPSLVNSFSQSGRAEAIRLVERVGLAERMNHPIKKLSGGEQQRVSIARSLINTPSLIFCDEPSGNLDHKNSVLIFELFKALTRELNTTFVVVSHSELLATYADRTIYLEDGKIVPKI